MLCFFQKNDQFFDSPILSGCPTLQFNFETSCPELAQTPYIEGSVPQDCPHFKTLVANALVSRFPALLLG